MHLMQLCLFRVGDQQPAEFVGREPEWLAGGVCEPGPGQRDVEQLPDCPGGDRTVFGAQAALEQQLQTLSQ
jgi:hypothetical protein